MKACRVWYTALRSTFCRKTLSRSTSAKYWGMLGSKVVRDPGELRPLAGRGQEGVRLPRQELHVLARAVLEHEGDAARRAHAGNDRRREREGLGLGNGGQPRADVGQDDPRVEALGDALIPGIEGDEVEGVVRREHRAEEAEAGDSRVVLDARRRP